MAYVPVQKTVKWGYGLWTAEDLMVMLQFALENRWRLVDVWHEEDEGKSVALFERRFEVVD